jgi:hypothetical protein
LATAPAAPSARLAISVVFVARFLTYVSAAVPVSSGSNAPCDLNATTAPSKLIDGELAWWALAPAAEMLTSAVFCWLAGPSSCRQ